MYHPSIDTGELKRLLIAFSSRDKSATDSALSIVSIQPQSRPRQIQKTAQKNYTVQPTVCVSNALLYPIDKCGVHRRPERDWSWSRKSRKLNRSKRWGTNNETVGMMYWLMATIRDRE